MDVIEETIEMKVIGKEASTKGLFFRRPAYKVAVQIVDPRATANVTMEREVSFHQYSSLHEGDLITSMMYSPDGERWTFSEEEARILSKR